MRFKWLRDPQTEVEKECERWDPLLCATVRDSMVPTLSTEQRKVFDDVISCARSKHTARPIIVIGRVGRGKTYLLRDIVASLRVENLIVLACATTALAAGNYDGGATAHYVFEIPVKEDSNTSEPFDLQS